jgi:hypothetical protein
VGQTTVPDLAGDVSRIAEGAFATAVRLGDRFHRAADLTSLRPHVFEALGGLLSGAGVITTTPEAEWWMGADPGRRSRLELDLDPESDGYVDLRRMPWFAVPLKTGRRHVTGPYVDYICTEEYIITFTVPVHRGPEIAGIAGVDITVGDLERRLRPALRTVGTVVALVNAQGRIITGNSTQHITGSLLRDPHLHTALRAGTPQTLPTGIRVDPCGTLPLAVVTWP